MASIRTSFHVSISKKPDCRKCRHYEKGKCRLFIEHYTKNKIIFAPVNVARMDDTMCGPTGMFWALSFDSDQFLYSDNPFWTQE